MGNKEKGKPCKPEKSSSPAQDQNNIHVYPDWAAMQAYYGRFAVSPYMNSAVGSPHYPPPYMWLPPQSMMHPYGVPYAAFYAHGGNYGHSGVSVAGTAFSMDTSVKSSENTDGDVVKKLKEGDGLAISKDNGNADSDEHGTDNILLDSIISEETDDSSNESSGMAVKAGRRGTKRSQSGSPNLEERDANANAKKKASSENMIKTSHPVVVAAKVEEGMDALLGTSGQNAKPMMQVPSEAWWRHDRQERRKQCNRESARRSRLRKQVENENLAIKVQTLTTENATLNSKIHDMMEISENLKLENAALMEKLKDARMNVEFSKMEDSRLKPVGTCDLLTRAEDNDPNNRSNEDAKRNSVANIHQILDAIAGRRADAVAAR